MVPDGWDQKHLEDVCDVKGGKRLPKGRSLVTRNTGFPYLRVSDMRMGGINIDTIQYVPEDVAPKIAAYRISSADLFITVAGTLGLVGEVPSELNGANLTENADKLTNIAIDKKYLLYYLQSDRIQRLIKTAQTQNAQPKLALKRIRKFPVLVPPAREQVRIAETLETWDRAISVLEQVIAHKRERKRGLMQVLLTGKKRFKEFGHKDWREYRIGEIITSSVPGDWGSEAADVEAATPVIRGTNFTKDMRLDLSPEKLVYRQIPESKRASLLLNPGNILLETSGGSPTQPVGRVAFFGGSSGVYGYSNFMRKLVVAPGFVPKAIYYALVNYYHSGRILRYQQQTTGIINFQTSDFLKTAKIMVPPMPEQRKIADTLDVAEAEIQLLERQLEVYRRQKRGLMQQLLTGKKRVHAEDSQVVPA